MFWRECSHHSCDSAFETAKKEDYSATTIRGTLSFVHSFIHSSIRCLLYVGHYIGDRHTKDFSEELVPAFTKLKGCVGFIAGYHRLLHNEQEIRDGRQVNMVVEAMLLPSWRLEDRTECGCGIRGSIMVQRLPESTGTHWQWQEKQPQLSHASSVKTGRCMKHVSVPQN